MKKAVLIAPPNDFATNVNVSQFTLLLAPPLSTLALGSYLTAQGVPVELVDTQMDFGFGLDRASERIVAQRLARHLEDQGEDIAWVGISQLSNATTGIVIAREIHAALPDIPIVFGGYFPSTATRPLLERYPFITAIVCGDGETAALRLSQDIAEGKPFLHDATPNLAWRNDGGIHLTHPTTTALEELPILDFDLLHNKSSYQIVNLMTSRGCPFHCNYCLESKMRTYSDHPPWWVDQQLAHLEEAMPNDHVFIYDPVFGLGKRRTVELCQVLGKRRFTYGVESRGDVLDPTLVPILSEAGVETIYLGIESASTGTLQRMNKIPSAAKARRYLIGTMEILEACFENNVTPVVGFMLGFPGDTEADYEASLEFAQAIRKLYDQTATGSGMEPGFVFFAFYTKVYDGSDLADRIAQDFPHTTLRPEPFVGERSVLSPSPGLDMDVTRRYRDEILHHGKYTPVSVERLWRYYSFSMNTFLTDHPELIDDQGVTMLRDYLRRFPQSCDAASMMTQYDKTSG